MDGERFLPEHAQFFAELLGDTDSDSEFEGFDADDIADQQVTEASEDPFAQWEEGERVQPEILYPQEPGPSITFDEASRPVDYFDSFVKLEDMEDMAHETNRYAEQKLTSMVLKPKSRFRQWRDTTVPEMTKFIAVVIAMGLIGQPNATDLWSSNPVLSTPFFPATMPRDRFLPLLSFLHLNDNTNYIPRGSPGYNPLFKLGQFFNRVLYRFSTTYRPHQFLSLDEGIVPWRGNLFFRVYNPDKPTKYGIKAYMLCDAVNGYCLKLKLYTGKRENPPSEFGATYDLVFDLLRGYFGKGHVLYCDNYYTSPKLFVDLWELGVAAVGTVRQNRKGLPDDLKQRRLDQHGDTFVMKTGPLSAIKHLDSKPVYLLSTFDTSENIPTGKRDPQSGQQLLRPKVVVQYNKYMGGVDRTDHMVSNAKIQIKSMKWWKKVFFHLLSLTVLNSYIKYKCTVRNPMPCRVFRRILVAQLVQRAEMGQPRVSVPGRPKSEQLERLTGRHFPKKVDGSRARTCVVCNPAMRSILETVGHKRKRPGHESRYMCSQCNVVLCVVPCFELYHTKQDYVLAYRRMHTEE